MSQQQVNLMMRDDSKCLEEYLKSIPEYYGINLRTPAFTSKMGWVCLPRFPGINLTNPVKLNDHEFICGIKRTGHYIENNNNYNVMDATLQVQELLKFSIITNKWSVALELDSKIDLDIPWKIDNPRLICFNYSTNTLYLSDRKSTIMQLNIDTMKHRVVTISEEKDAEECIGLINQLEFIEAHRTILVSGKNKHSVLSLSAFKTKFANITLRKTKFCDNLNLLSTYGDVQFHKSIYLPLKKCIYTFGRYIVMGLSVIVVFNLNTNKSNLIAIDREIFIPDRKGSFGCVGTTDEKYIIIFGGKDSDYHCYDEIYIFDTDTMRVRKSNIICPFTGSCYAILINKDLRQMMIVIGYIRHCWRLKEFRGMIFPYSDIVDLICQWFGGEIIYLQERGSDQLLWKIELNKILNKWIFESFMITKCRSNLLVQFQLTTIIQNHIYYKRER